MIEMERYQQELKKQLGFLRRSCQLYDEGEVDEAIRIAVPIRTTIHDTRNSTSLLTHLDAEGIKLWSSIAGAPENAVWYQGMGLYKQWRYGNRAGASYGPMNVEVTPIDTEIGIYSFTCPYCKGRIVWDPRELRPPAPR